KPKPGFVEPAKLKRDQLIALACSSSHALEVGGVVRKKSATPPLSRIGGRPPIAFPKIGRHPVGFLFQLETRDLLKKHAGVAAFCAIDGSATEGPEENRVVLLRAGDLKRTVPEPKSGPLKASLPPTLSVRPITIEKARVEIDEARTAPLITADPALAEAI